MPNGITCMNGKRKYEPPMRDSESNTSRSNNKTILWNMKNKYKNWNKNKSTGDKKRILNIYWPLRNLKKSNESLVTN